MTTPDEIAMDIDWHDVDGLVCAGIADGVAYALALAARSGARARGAELVAGLQLVVLRFFSR
jgi:hypothetical protein